MVSLVLIRIDGLSATDLFDGQAKKGLGLTAWCDLDKYLAAWGG